MEHLGGARSHAVVSAGANVAYSGRGQTYDKQVGSGCRWEVWHRPCDAPVLEYFLCLMGCKIKSKSTRRQSGSMHRTDISVDLCRSWTVHLSLGPRSRVTWKASMSCLLIFKLVRQLSIMAVSGLHREQKIIRHLKKEANSTNQPKKQSKQCLSMECRLVLGFFPSYLRVTKASNLLWKAVDL